MFLLFYIQISYTEIVHRTRGGYPRSWFRLSIGLNFIGQNFRRTKFSSPLQIFVTFVRQKILSIDNFVLFLKSRQWALNLKKKKLDKIFVGPNFSSDKIFVTSKKFRHFRPDEVSLIRLRYYLCVHIVL